MATLFRIDTETLPRVLVLDPPVTDAEVRGVVPGKRQCPAGTHQGRSRSHEPAHWWMDRQRKSGNSATVGELERRQGPGPRFRFEHRLPASRRINAKPGRFLCFPGAPA